jgi:S-sulfosulfanyl-L-cysteine sulfohydrolase
MPSLPIDFVDLAQRFGRFGGYAQIATLVKQIRDERQGRVLLLDGGDTLHGSATALWTRGRDMLEVINLLGVDIFTAHWEFTYGSDTVREYFGDVESDGLFNGQFLAQNVRDSEWYDDAFKPYVVRRWAVPGSASSGRLFPMSRFRIRCAG